MASTIDQILGWGDQAPATPRRQNPAQAPVQKPAMPQSPASVPAQGAQGAPSAANTTSPAVPQQVRPVQTQTVASQTETAGMQPARSPEGAVQTAHAKSSIPTRQSASAMMADPLPQASQSAADALNPFKERGIKVPGTNPAASGKETDPEAIDNRQTNEPGIDGEKPVGKRIWLPGETPKTMGEAADYVEQKTGLSPEEQKKEDKRRRLEAIFSAIGDGVSSLANLYFTTKGAPNMYDPKNSLSAKNREYWDKLLKDRKDNADAYYKRVVDAIKYGDGQAWKDWQKERAKERDDADDAKTKWEQDYKKDRANAEDQKFDRTYNQKQQQIDNTAKSHEDNYKIQVAKVGNERERLARQSKNDSYSFSLGDGTSLDVPKGALNESNVAYVYSQLPEDVRKTFSQQQKINKLTGQPETRPVLDENGKPKKDENGRPMTEPVMEQKVLDKDDMLAIIGANINDRRVQKAMYRIAGRKPGNPMDGGGKKTVWD